jgi:hypothetical protein
MKNFELVIDDEPINVPDEVTLGMYQEMNKFPDKYNRGINIISLFTGITLRELKNQSVDTIELLEAVVSEKFIIPEKNELVMTFEYNGQLYGLENDWSKLAFGAWIDFEVYSSEDIFSNIHKIMAILYRPVISQDKKTLKYKIVPYNSDDIEERANIMKLAPVRFWLGASVFFSQIVSIYTTSIKSSLDTTHNLQKVTIERWKKLPKFLKKILPLDSILPSYTASQKKILQRLMK